MLVTTEKDFVRLPEDDGSGFGELRFRSRPLPIAIEFERGQQAEAASGRGDRETTDGLAGVGWVSRKRLSEAAASA